MYVRCEFCQTAFYEPAFAWGEILSVECVSCSAQIELSPSAVPPERDLWTIVTSDGRVLSFSCRAQVETAIIAGLVRAGDRLLGGDAPSTPVEHVAELSDYFCARSGLERTVPYGLMAPEPSAAHAAAHADSLERALLELAGAPQRDSSPSLFEARGDASMARRRSSDLPPPPKPPMRRYSGARAR